MNKDISFWLVALLGASHTLNLAAQPTGTFTATGSMTTVRRFHTATVLADGRVLIAGGIQLVGSPPENEAVASAELYDPSTGVFTPTGDMTTARYYHSATLLPDGRVLIAGGGTPAVAAASAELYDPSTGVFTATVATTAVGGKAALLRNGEILITGYNAAELYDPVTGSFAPTGSYVGPFSYGPYFYLDTDTALPDGRVLIVGTACDDCWLEHEEIYDPATGTFTVTGNLHTIDYEGDIGSGATATLLPNGKVLLAGGAGYVKFFSVAELYDPSANTFRFTANMTMARNGHTATLLPDGTVLVAGGQSYSPGYPSVSSAELYDPSTRTFAAAANMTMARAGHSATLLPDGRVLISGGFGDSGPGLASAEIYTPPVLVPAPALFSLTNDGKRQGAIWHATSGQAASSQDPAVAGEILSMYTTSLMEGGVVPPQVSVGGRLADTLFFGDAPGYPGYFQVNFRVPNGVAPGSAVSVRLQYFGRLSNEVTIGVR